MLRFFWGKIQYMVERRIVDKAMAASITVFGWTHGPQERHVTYGLRYAGQRPLMALYIGSQLPDSLGLLVGFL